MDQNTMVNFEKQTHTNRNLMQKTNVKKKKQTITEDSKPNHRKGNEASKIVCVFREKKRK